MNFSYNKEAIKEIMKTIPKDENIKAMEIEWFNNEYAQGKNYVTQHPDENMQKYYEKKVTIYDYGIII